jgi:hypothetical protein
MMTKSSPLSYRMDSKSTWDKGRDRNTRQLRPTKSKGLQKQIHAFQAAMASGKPETASKKKQDSEANPEQVKILNERDEKGDCFKGAISSDRVHSSPQKEDDVDSDCGNEGRGEPIGTSQQPDPVYGAGHQKEPSIMGTTRQQPRIDFQRYQDIIDKISVNHASAGDPKEVNIKFKDETLDGARVVISKNGDKIKIRWQTTSESVYRMLIKQRLGLQQHVYGRLGIKSEVSVNFKKTLKPRFAHKKREAGRRGTKRPPVDAL